MELWHANEFVVSKLHCSLHFYSESSDSRMKLFFIITIANVGSFQPEQNSSPHHTHMRAHTHTFAYLLLASSHCIWLRHKRVGKTHISTTLAKLSLKHRDRGSEDMHREFLSCSEALPEAPFQNVDL